MIDLGVREREKDDRRINTDPLDSKKQHAYDQRPNPFERIMKPDDNEFPDNCYAVPSKIKKPKLDPSQILTKVIQTGEKVMSGEEYDRDFERRMQELERLNNLAEERKESRVYGKVQDDDDENTPLNGKKKKQMRGRKGKYYSQVDDEDQSFLE